MERFTIKQLQNNLIQVRCDTIEQANKIWKASGQNDYWNIGNKDTKEYYILCYRETKSYHSYPAWMEDGQYFKKEYGVDKTIEFNQIDFEENLLNNIQIW